jgi:hypothetical protein
VLVYRDGSREVCAAELQAELFRSVHGLGAAPSNSSDHLLTALLRAGALECALSDAGSDAASVVAGLTDALADALVSGDPGNIQREVAKRAEFLPDLRLPVTVRASVPEGFAYYALDPLAYAMAVEGVEIAGRPVFVVGLRTIGATLSAVVAAAARRRSAVVERITVRPSGHPFDRRTEFSPQQGKSIVEAAARRALFLVVDEGPGLSGSSLLSAAEALNAIERSEIVVLCAHAPDTTRLCAPQAAARWAKLRVIAAGSTAQPPTDASSDWSGGQWRRHLYKDAASWPAAWPQVERLKYLSRDGARLYKFEGLGPYGEAPVERARAAAAAKWSPAVERGSPGFVSYTRIHGRPLHHRDLDSQIIDMLAHYCDFRRREMPVAHASIEPLREMLRVNVREEFGFDHEPETAEIVHPVVADARLMPHEWLRDSAGRLWKTDVASHGDDHFYPGPTDIAWDLAGAVVEWRLREHAAETFLGRYRRLSGDDARERLPFFVCAYSAYRLGFCRMAAEACPEERERLTAAAEYYRTTIQSVTRRRLPAAS